MPGTRLFCTTSPEISVLSGSTKISSSPLVWAFAQPEQPRRDAAQIHFRLGVEDDIRLAHFHVREQLGPLRRLLAEPRDHFGAMRFHLLLLHSIANQNRVVREARLAGRVFGMKMRGGQVQQSARRKLLHDARDGRSIARTEARIHHQRAAGSHHDGNVREAHDGVDVLGNTRRGFRQQRRDRSARQPEQRTRRSEPAALHSLFACLSSYICSYRMPRSIVFSSASYCSAMRGTNDKRGRA